MPRVIGILPGSFKPYHAGHDALVRIASSENDVVHLLVSVSDRDGTSGDMMSKIWRDYISSTLPENVILQLSAGSPVKKTFDILAASDSQSSDEMFRIYSDDDDISKYTSEKLNRSAPRLSVAGRIELRGVARTETINVSGTMMRHFVATNNRAMFIKHLPRPLQSNGHEIFNMLKKHRRSI